MGVVWLSVVGALRRTAPGSGLVRALTAAPDLDGWAVVERLLKDLARLDERVWLVVDDVHELGARRRGGSWSCWCCGCRWSCGFVLAIRAGVRLGLHRLRLLEGTDRDPRGGSAVQRG